jgi:hypothetical protein
MEFDESVTIDIVADIKFSLVRMALPLGSKFECASAFLALDCLWANE